MNKCTRCNEDINGIDEFGSIHEPMCFSCWLDSEVIPDDDEDYRIHNVAEKHRDEIGNVIECSSCGGSGKSKREIIDANGVTKNASCSRCRGYGKLIGVVCDDCDGHGEVEHNCDCDLCTITHEECTTCLGRGVEYVHHQIDLPFIPKNVKTFWVA